MAKVKKTSDKPNVIIRFLVRTFVAIVVIFCVFSIISVQNNIVEKQKELAKLEEDIEVMKMQNEELYDIIASDDIGRYMEKLAVENSSHTYAYPDERRYYDTSRD